MTSHQDAMFFVVSIAKTMRPGILGNLVLRFSVECLQKNDARKVSITSNYILARLNSSGFSLTREASVLPTLIHSRTTSFGSLVVETARRDVYCTCHFIRGRLVEFLSLKTRSITKKCRSGCLPPC